MTPADGLSQATAPPPFRPLPMKGADAEVVRREDGSILIRSNHAPGEGPRSIAHLLKDRADAHPDRPFLKQRRPGHGPWRTCTYGEAQRAAEGIASWLLERGLGPEDAVLILSGNSIDHALVMLGCYAAGVPAAPISPAYSLLSTDLAKLRHAYAVLRPKVVYAEDPVQFARALEALRQEDPQIAVIAPVPGEGVTPLPQIVGRTRSPAAEAALERLTAASVAKYLFTSGSTGMPKGVPQTHGMMTSLIAAQEGLRLGDEPPPEEPPQALEWMPWSHISAGNIGFNGAMWAGGAIHLDEGKPIPGMFETTIKNLYEVSPVVFGSAPVAFAMLAAAMEGDPVLRRSFFKNLRYMGYGGATLSNDIYERMQALAIAETGRRIPLTTMYGATETQGITVVHWETDRVGLVGLPLPGITLKLVPNGAKYEVRVKGPTVASGYHNDPVKSREAFDEEGFYKLGDAAKFVDPEDPQKGLVFDGRVTEDFKLSSGTWVSVGTLRPDVVAALTPLVADAVIVGQDKPFAGALLWPSAAGARVAAEEGPQALAQRLVLALRVFNRDSGGSSRRIQRFRILTTPPSIDAGEITDKGYVNQRAALERRREEASSLFAEPPPEGVVAV